MGRDPIMRGGGGKVLYYGEVGRDESYLYEEAIGEESYDTGSFLQIQRFLAKKRPFLAKQTVDLQEPLAR